MTIDEAKTRLGYESYDVPNKENLLELKSHLEITLGFPDRSVQERNRVLKTLEAVNLVLPYAK